MSKHPAHKTEKISYIFQVTYNLIATARERLMSHVFCRTSPKLQESFLKDTGMLTYNVWGFSTVLACLALMLD